MAERCAEYLRLESEVEQSIAKVAETTTHQLELFRSRDFAEMMRLDKQLELLVGQKERAIGALRQHAREHQCHFFATLE